MPLDGKQYIIGINFILFNSIYNDFSFNLVIDVECVNTLTHFDFRIEGKTL